MFKTTLKIDGMMCSMCESHVNDLIRQRFAVKKVTSSHTKRESVIISETAQSEDAIASALESIGYKLTGCETEPYEKHGLFGFGRK